MGGQLYQERFVWFDHEARTERYPNYTDPTFQLPVINHSEEELLALLTSRKLIIEASSGSMADELGECFKAARYVADSQPVGTGQS